MKELGRVQCTKLEGAVDPKQRIVEFSFRNSEPGFGATILLRLSKERAMEYEPMKVYKLFLEPVK